MASDGNCALDTPKGSSFRFLDDSMHSNIDKMVLRNENGAENYNPKGKNSD